MDTDRSGDLVIDEVEWEGRAGNGWLLRRLFDLLLRDPALPAASTGPELTNGDSPATLRPETLTDEKRGER